MFNDHWVRGILSGLILGFIISSIIFILVTNNLVENITISENRGEQIVDENITITNYCTYYYYYELGNESNIIVNEVCS